MNLLKVIREELAESRQEPSPGARTCLWDSGKKQKRGKRRGKAVMGSPLNHIPKCHMHNLFENFQGWRFHQMSGPE